MSEATDPRRIPLWTRVAMMLGSWGLKEKTLTPDQLQSLVEDEDWQPRGYHPN